MRRYENIYILSCRESNLSPDRLLPGLTLREPDTELDREEPPLELQGIFPFDDLPLTVQFQILGHLLVFPGQMIHVLTRLDPHYHPESLDSALFGNDYDNLQLLHRFHIGCEPVNVTYATRPEDLLAPLLVCRKWLMFGAEQFYSGNTFCFSGLGELARFAKGIKGRWQRVRSIELLWIGNQWLTWKWNERGKRTSRRAQALMWLVEALRLTHLKVWIPESSKFYTRRRHEPRGVIRYMTNKTKRQPNYRLCRGLRTTQGLDYVLCLRGLMDVSWWDHDIWVKHNAKKRVRDWTFEQDVKFSTYMAKDPEDVEKARLRNLVKLLKEWDPPVEFWQVVLNSIPDIIASAKEGSRSRGFITINDTEDDGSESDNNNNDSSNETPSSSSSGSGSSSSSDSASDSSSGDEGETSGTQRVVLPSTFYDPARSTRTSPGDGGLPGSNPSHISLDFHDLGIVADDDDSDVEITGVRDNNAPCFDLTDADDTQTATAHSSQTVGGGNMLSGPPRTTAPGQDIHDDENPEGSMFVSGRATTAGSGDSNEGAARASTTPQDATNQINEHLASSGPRFGSGTSHSPRTSTGRSESSLFCSETRYQDAARGSTSSSSPTWRDGTNGAGSSACTPIDLTQDTEMTAFEYPSPREDLKRSQSEDGGSPPKRSRPSGSPSTGRVQEIE